MPAVVVPTSMRRVDVLGDDRVRYLDDVTTQRLADVPTTHVTSALYLDPQGAPLAAFDVAVLGDRLALLVPDDEVAHTVTEVLGGRTFLLDARFEPTDHEIVAVRGEDAEQVISAAGLTAVPGRCRLAGDLLIVHREGGIDVAGPSTAVDDAVTALVDAGAKRGDADDLLAWRVAAGVPGWAVEVRAPHLPEEVGLLPTHVHLGKGCYPGQEAIARMWMLGRPRRRLANVAVTDGNPQAGWSTGKGRHTVELTSVSPREPEALAFVPSDAGPGDVFEGEDGVHVEVQRLIGDDPAPPGHDPAVARRRDRPRT